MPNGRDEPDCLICIHRRITGDRPGSVACGKHSFTMPYSSDHVICADWRHHAHPEAGPHFRLAMRPGVLYRWEPYTQSDPTPVGAFTELVDLIVDRHLKLVQYPEHGWCIVLGGYERVDLMFPEGSTVLLLDGEPVPWMVTTLEISVVYNHPPFDGPPQLTTKLESMKLLRPDPVGAARVQAWLAQHRDLARDREVRRRQVADRRHLDKNLELSYLVRLAGSPRAAGYTLEFYPHQLLDLKG